MIERQSLLIIGAMKSGTTSLADTLETRSDFVFPAGKEPRTLALQENEFQQSIEDYIGLMRNAQPGLVVGDASPQYTFRQDESANRALSIHGQNTCVVYILRDPIARAWSHFQHAWRSGWKMRPDASDAFDQEPVLKDISCYTTHLSEWKQRYPNIIVRRFEDIIRDPSELISEICLQTNARPPEHTDTLSHLNPSQLHGNLRLPSGIQRVARKLKKSPTARLIYRSKIAYKIRESLTDSPEPPRPSRESLQRYRDYIIPKCQSLYEQLQWGTEQHWDLDRSIDRISTTPHHEQLP